MRQPGAIKKVHQRSASIKRHNEPLFQGNPFGERSTCEQPAVPNGWKASRHPHHSIAGRSNNAELVFRFQGHQLWTPRPRGEASPVADVHPSSAGQLWRSRLWNVIATQLVLILFTVI